MTDTSTSSGRAPSLRGQLTALFGVLAVALLLLQGYWSYHDYRGARQQAWADALAFADAVDLSIRQYLDQSEELLKASAIQSGADWFESDSCTEEMTSLQQLLPFDNVLVVNLAGEIVCSAEPVGPDASGAEWPWFDAFVANGRFTTGAPAEADFTDGWILPLVAPIRDDSGELLGGLVGATPLASVSELLRTIRPGADHLITLASPDSIVVARSSDAERWVGRDLPPPSGTDRLVAPGRWVAQGPDLTGIARTWGQLSTDAGWLIYVGVPDAVVFGPAMREALGHMAGTLLIVLAALFLGFLSYRRIAGALKELARRTRTLDPERSVTLPAQTPREVREVAEQYNAALAARLEAEQAERVARKRYQTLFDNAVFGLLVVSDEDRIIEMNSAAARMLGHDSTVLVGSSAAALYTDPEEHGRLIEAARTPGSEPVELTWRTLEGMPIVVRVGATWITGPHGEELLEIIAQDVTEEVRAEARLRQKQKLEAIGQLAGGVAHDFNNLLTVISGNVELLEDDLDHEPELKDDLAQIRKATRRAASLTRRLLSFSRRTPRGVQALELNEVTAELVRMLDPILGEKIELRVELSSEPCPVSIDPGDLEQVLVNLVLNARDAIPGDGEIHIATRREPGDPRGAVLLVSDDGVGMSPETRARMFDPFFSTKPRGEGTGLGLSTVYSIVEQAGGAIDVESAPGRGTRIEVRLPTRSTREGPEGERTDDVVGGNETILLAEDEEQVRTFVRRALERVGFQVVEAAGGGEAVKILEARGEDIDLVLTDVIMPEVGGLELATMARVHAPSTPVLFMSGYVGDVHVREALEEGNGQLLDKPFTAVEVVRAVRAVLDGGLLESPSAADA